MKLEVLFWERNITKERMADLVKEVGDEIRKGHKGEVVSGIPCVEGISWKVTP
jgi:hypothetical protein